MSRQALSGHTVRRREIRIEVPGRDPFAVWVRGITSADSRHFFNLAEGGPDKALDALVHLLAAGIVEEDGSPSFDPVADREDLENIPNEIGQVIAAEIKELSGMGTPPERNERLDPTAG